ncbi:MAG: conserved rane protein of unknown function [Candidatus Saccharibacteria bacterium]|nr:conserved rane protein of unknown function [Candidatus Saccharibacteria bacterium]
MAEKRKTAKSQTSIKSKKKAAASRPQPKSVAEPSALSVLPNSFKLTAQAFAIIRTFWRPLTGIILVYFLLSLLFVGALPSLSTVVHDAKYGQSGSFASGLSIFGGLLSHSGSSSTPAGSLLQTVLFIIDSLVIIWALRQLLAGKIVGIKESYYNSMYPLIPFILVLFVLIIELLPLSLGAAILSAILNTAVSSVTPVVILGWLIFLAGAAWSLYMFSASVFALYIVTLPDMHPREALRSARRLARTRLRQILPRLLYLPLFILLAMALILVPLIIFVSSMAAPVFLALGLLSLLFAHTYLYSLYRSLIA